MKWTLRTHNFDIDADNSASIVATSGSGDTAKIQFDFAKSSVLVIAEGSDHYVQSRLASVASDYLDSLTVPGIPMKGTIDESDGSYTVEIL